MHRAIIFTILLIVTTLAMAGCKTPSLNSIQLGSLSRERPSYLYLKGVATATEVKRTAAKRCKGTLTFLSESPAATPPSFGDWQEMRFSCNTQK